MKKGVKRLAQDPTLTLSHDKIKYLYYGQPVAASSPAVGSTSAAPSADGAVSPSAAGAASVSAASGAGV